MNLTDEEIENYLLTMGFTGPGETVELPTDDLRSTLTELQRLRHFKVESLKMLTECRHALYDADELHRAGGEYGQLSADIADFISSTTEEPKATEPQDLDTSESGLGLVVGTGVNTWSTRPDGRTENCGECGSTWAGPEDASCPVCVKDGEA